MKENNELTIVIEEFKLKESESKMILDTFGPLYVKANKLAVIAGGVKVTNVDQVEEMEKSREMRLALREVRIEANKTREHLKEGYLRGANAIQRMFNDIRDITKPEEDRLLKQEKFAEKLKEEKLLNVELKRSSELGKYVDDTSVFRLHPNELSTESFDKLLNSSKTSFEATEARNKKLEEERIALEKLESEKQEEIRRDNIKLRQEAKEREAKEIEATKKRDAIEAKRLTEEVRLKKIRLVEQKKIDDKVAADKAAVDKKHQELLRKERQAKEAAENKLREEQAESKRVEDAKQAKITADKKTQEEAERKELLAPDKQKLIKMKDEITFIEWPALKSKEAQDICESTMKKLQKVVEELQEDIKKL